MSSFLVILIGTVLVNTFLLMHEDEALGGDRHSRSIARAIRIAVATAIALVIATSLTTSTWSLVTRNDAFNDAAIFLFSGAVVAIVALLHRVVTDRLPRLRRSMQSSPIIVIGNSLSLGTLLLPAMTGHSLGETFVAAAALGTGFAIVLVSFIALAARITEQEVPSAFRLAPITLISAGLTALALMGFTGLLRS